MLSVATQTVHAASTKTCEWTTFSLCLRVPTNKTKSIVHKVHCCTARPQRTDFFLEMNDQWTNLLAFALTSSSRRKNWLPRSWYVAHLLSCTVKDWNKERQWNQEAQQTPAAHYFDPEFGILRINLVLKLWNQDVEEMTSFSWAWILLFLSRTKIRSEQPNKNTHSGQIFLLSTHLHTSQDDVLCCKGKRNCQLTWSRYDDTRSACSLSLKIGQTLHVRVFGKKDNWFLQ